MRGESCAGIMAYKAPRGTHDVLPGEAPAWLRLENAFRETCRRFGYGEIRTPVFEEAELFSRAEGEGTDIVVKEMYTFTDRGGRSITLRPEGTPPVLRAYIEHKIYGEPGTWKVFYIAPMFRYDRPQKGRYRQHHQFGIEAVGALGPDIDAEVIWLARDFLSGVGVRDWRLEVNSIGCPQCRPAYLERLRDALRPHLGELCALCQERFERNPLRILDEKNPQCQEAARDAPSILDHLCADCRRHFDGLLALLGELGIAYAVNSRIVRGLDYYSRTAFEILHGGLGAQQNAIVGGGRYDGLVEALGGPPTPGVGFGCGVERLALAAGAGEPAQDARPGSVYVAVLGEEGQAAGLRLLKELRSSGLAAHADYLHRSLKAQMKEADRLGCSHVLILGDEELAAGEVTVRDMKTGAQQRLPVQRAAHAIG